MDDVMANAFHDEMAKIAANLGTMGVKPNAIQVTGTKPNANVLKPQTGPTNYTAVNAPTSAPVGSAMGSKSMPPPPVRT